MTSGLSSTISLAIDDYHQLLICIWESNEDMYAHSHMEPPFNGCYIGIPYVENVPSGRRWLPMYFGEIHLVLDYMGAGYFAHELQHAVLDWVSAQDLEDDEEICDLSGRLTSEFWTKFYELYEEVPNMAKVTKEDREKSKKRSGDKKYPMETAAQVRSAIRLRHHSDTVSASEVLSRASRAISRLLKAGKISASTAESLRNKVKEARARDKSKDDYRKKEKGNSNMDIAAAIDKAAGSLGGV